MKEIDLLPEWYKNGRRQRIGYRTQYIALCGIFAVMMVWNFIAAHSVSTAAAELASLESKTFDAESVSREFSKVKNEVTQLQMKANILEEMDSNISD